MEDTQWGRMVVIDVNTGDYEIADDDLTATLRLIERQPDAITWGELVGYPAPYYMRSPVPNQVVRRGRDIVISGRVELTGFIADHPILEPRVAVAVAGR